MGSVNVTPAVVDAGILEGDRLRGATGEPRQVGAGRAIGIGVRCPLHEVALQLHHALAEIPVLVSALERRVARDRPPVRHVLHQQQSADREVAAERQRARHLVVARKHHSWLSVMVCPLAMTMFAGSPLPAVRIQQLHQFVVHGLRLFGTGHDRSCGAVLQVIAHQFAANRPQGLVHRGDLRHDVGAVAVVVDHFLEPAHLALDTTEALAIALLGIGVNGDRGAGTGIGGDAAAALDDTCRGDGGGKGCPLRVHSITLEKAGQKAGPWLRSGRQKVDPHNKGSIRTTRDHCTDMPRSRRLFATTLTELNAIAALARMGLSSNPNAG